MTDTGFTSTDCQQNLQTRRLVYGAQQFAYLFLRLYAFYIHNSEYIIKHIRNFEYDVCNIILGINIIISIR